MAMLFAALIISSVFAACSSIRMFSEVILIFFFSQFFQLD